MYSQVVCETWYRKSDTACCLVLNMTRVGQKRDRSRMGGLKRRNELAVEKSSQDACLLK